MEKIKELEKRLKILKNQYCGQEELQNMITELDQTIKYLKGESRCQQKIFPKKDNLKLEINTIPYREMINTNTEYKKDISTHYLGKKLTYGKLIENIDNVAVGLTNIGIKRNDIVSICMPSTLETVYLFYALNKIGAVVNAIDPRKDEDEIKYCINNAETKHIFVIDVAAEKVRKILEKTSLKKVYIVSPVESLPFPIKIAYNPRLWSEELNSKDKKIAYWHDFVRATKEQATVIEDTYEYNKLGIIEYTSGTTGRSKGVEITNDAICGIARQYDLSGLNHERGDKFYNGIPIFLAFGEALGIHMPYMFGMQNIIVPAMKSETILYDLMKYKPEHTSLTPMHYIIMCNNPDFKKYDMSNVKTQGIGADGMTIAAKRNYDEQAKANGCKVKTIVGYGNTEHNSSFSTERQHQSKYGSCGKCLDGNEAYIVNLATKELLPPNVVGQLVLKGKYPMRSYMNNDEETQKAFVDLGNGVSGIYLGDYAYIDNEGYIFVKGRKKDQIKISEIENLWPIDIENYISLCRKISCCAVAGQGSGQFKQPLIYIVRKNGYSQKEIADEIKPLLANLYKMYNVEFQYVFVTELPLTLNGKIDRTILSSSTVFDYVQKDTGRTRTKKI